MRREMGIIGCVFLFSIATIKPLFSQELYNEKQKGGLFSRPSQFDHRLNGAYFQWYLHDTKELIIAPGRWKKKDWLILGGSTATAALLVFTVDKPAQEFFEEHQDSDFIKGMNKILNPFKALTVPVYFGAVPIVYGLIARSNRAKKVGLEVLEAQLVTSVVHYPGEQ